MSLTENTWKHILVAMQVQLGSLGSARLKFMRLPMPTIADAAFHDAASTRRSVTGAALQSGGQRGRLAVQECW